MTSSDFTNSGMDERQLMPSIIKGFRGKCPSCGEGKLFAYTLKVQENCPNCNEDLSHHRADDLPAYLNILVVGHVVVGLMMVVYQWKLLEMWTLAGITVAAAILCAGIMMRPLKGSVVGAQWALRMHGFGGHDD